MGAASLVKRRWVYRPPHWVASLILAGALGLALSRPLPPAALSPVQPMLGEASAAAALTGRPDGEVLLLTGQGPAAGEYLLVTAASGPAAGLLPELARSFRAHGSSRSLLLAAGEDPAPPGPVAAHLHLDFRVEERSSLSVKAAGGSPPVWLRQLARAAVAAEAGLAPETLGHQLRALGLVAGRPGPTLAAVTLAGTGPGAPDLAAFGRAAERLLHSLDELPLIPRPSPAGMGRSSTLYLVMGSRYLPGPGLWAGQLLALLPLGMAVGRGVRRVRRPWRWLDDDGSILAAVQILRSEQGKLPPSPGQTRAERRRRRLQGAWRPLVGEAAWGLIWLGGGLALAAGAGGRLPLALAGAALAGAGWMGREPAGAAEDRGWATLVLLTLLVLAAALATGGSPIVLVALYPAALFWPFRSGHRAGDCVLTVAGLVGAAWLLAVLPWPPPGPPGLLLLAVAALAAGALRLALERPPAAGGDLD